MTANPSLQRLHEAGVSIWLDTLSRELLESGEFAELIRDYSVTGATSNPTIFAKAITGSDRYDEEPRRLAARGSRDTQELFFSLALDDIRAAARLLRAAGLSRPRLNGPSAGPGALSYGSSLTGSVLSWLMNPERTNSGRPSIAIRG
jgi:hypothetical protein